MPRTGLTSILYVLDRSGSMGVVWDDAVAAFDHFIGQQQALPGDAEFGLTDFDNVVTRHAIMPIDAVPKLSSRATDIFPRGMTALLDAVGRTVHEAGAEFAARPESDRPERVLLIIQTDGQENSSREYNADEVRRMIEHQKAHYAWEVLFLGADQDAWNAGRMFAADSTLATDADDGAHQREAAMYITDNVSAFRRTGKLYEKGPKDIRKMKGGFPKADPAPKSSR